ncbi:hypothetical protein GOP47_0000405 [Adiantum capillus-veneris]|uniref:NAD(P)-binding domain-containing protein n=1 Tax=Adiantum capillus-veneris TaxID=13818 RepID=A0A9D4ZSB1_ADICA|nr:hypothetical protein GOP47_0000405 [Adiantum capillus-veneris]
MAGAAAAAATPAAISSTALLSAPNATCCSSLAFRSQAQQLQARSLTVSCQHHLHRPYQPTNLQAVICAAYTSGTNEFSADPIDVVAKVQTEKIVVLGGSGFVGSAVCKAAVGQGIDVVSLSRSGRPSYNDAWVDQVVWIAGDVFNADWDGLLNGATAVVSTIGGFGTNEQMEQLNGEANVLAINAASNAGVRKFVYISVHDYNFPDFVKSVGYFTGKKRAEAEVLAKFTTTGTVLRPGFIYGKRRVNGIDIPLNVVGEPLEKVLDATKTFTRPLSSLPASDFFFAPPVSVDDVANAAIKAVTDDDVFGVQTIEQIKELASSVRAR